MACKCAKFDEDEGRYYCDVSGDQCVYLIPNSKKCAEEWGEGPDAVETCDQCKFDYNFALGEYVCNKCGCVQVLGDK